jgi:hypothetical protein
MQGFSLATKSKETPCFQIKERRFLSGGVWCLLSGLPDHGILEYLWLHIRLEAKNRRNPVTRETRFCYLLWSFADFRAIHFQKENSQRL